MTHCTARRAREDDFDAVLRQMVIDSPSIQLVRPAIPIRQPAPVATGIEALYRKLVARVVEPMLRCASREEFISFVRKNLKSFIEINSAMRVTLESIDPSSLEGLEAEFDKALVHAARTLAGEEGAEEAQFATATFERITPLTERFHLLDCSKFVVQRLLAELQLNVNLHMVAALAILVAAQSPEVRATSAGIEGAFELLRGGALHGYAAAREAIDGLVVDDSSSDSTEEGAFDDEDWVLAIAG